MAFRTPSPTREGATPGSPRRSVTALPPVPPPGGAIRRLAGLLDQAGYNATRVRAHLGVGSLFDLGGAAPPESRAAAESGTTAEAGTLPGAVSVLVDLFLRGRRVPRAQLDEALGAGAASLLLEAGVVRGVAGGGVSGDGPAEEAEGSEGRELAATLLLYPVGPVLIASDLTPDAPGCLGGELDTLPPEAVYPALAGPNRSFLADLPGEPCPGDLLDLCGGTGVAALLSAAGAGVSGTVISADVSPRAAAFAALGGALNGVELEAVTGDLWAPVAGRRFARILAHPPYLPSVDGDHAFRDGGLDGERLLRRVLEGLPAHLAPGGLFHGHGLVVETEEESAEERVRGFLKEGRAGGGEGGTGPDAGTGSSGEPRSEPDLWLFEHEAFTPADFVVRQMQAGRMEAGAADRHLAGLARAGVRRFVRGSIFVRAGGADDAGESNAPKPNGCPPLTLRRSRGTSPGVLTGSGELDEAGSAELAAFRQSTRRLARARAGGTVGRLRCRLAPGARIQVSHGAKEGELVPEAAALVRDGALPARVGIPVGALPLVPRFDGTRTPGQVRRETVAAGEIPDAVSTADIRHLVEGLLDAGLLLPGDGAGAG
ncbi:MAG: hypothetical protein EA352_04245 [Gemmatimonadales bacterium]|nr:MAG: hypothetical protein EA352_04245 [Gemmatimonadales bacterium]